MHKDLPRVAVACPPSGVGAWQTAALAALGQSGVPVTLPEAGACPPWLPAPWGLFLGREKAAPVAGGLVAPGASGAELLLAPPGLRAGAELAALLPLGLLEVEAFHPALARDGALEGRVLWRRATAPGRLETRLAASVATCMEGPLPGGWAANHLAKLSRAPAGILARMGADPEAFWNACPPCEPLPPFRPSGLSWLRFAADLARWGLTRAWQDLLHRRQWFLAVRPGGGDPLAPGFAARRFAPLYPPKGTGWADPLFFSRGGRSWLFIEEIPPSGRGVISVMDFDGKNFGPPRRVLEEPFHLSYPNVFEHGGEAYMLPETSQAGQVRLYRATDFPGGWVLDRVLLDGLRAVDATLVEHGGAWWLLANVRGERGSSWDELHVFKGPSPLGPFTPHRLNPVVSDVRRARPAGRIARLGGRLVRYGQDCSGWYGRALAVTEITRLDDDGYEERPLARLEPGLIEGGSFCLHTFDALAGGSLAGDAQAGLEVVDGQRRVLLWR
ncbi:glucosamine inositolphosphorylceramide transferase family protein [Fundidesulfovibrio agrisoli]|uniref:glucosamine inositolphosphorylceramide transferase family protein n=1 Tax=Fundidesulfovibrio agrisoli TaxID=2922717 RepID=UPI001FADA531|nr:hypothetical protein [Fundidesulfovibrio agrisoli]